MTSLLLSDCGGTTKQGLKWPFLGRIDDGRFRLSRTTISLTYTSLDSNVLVHKLRTRSSQDLPWRHWKNNVSSLIPCWGPLNFMYFIL